MVQLFNPPEFERFKKQNHRILYLCTMHDPVDDLNNYKWNIFYYNIKDPRILVPKRRRYLGWSLNFAHKESYLAMFLVLFVTFMVTL